LRGAEAQRRSVTGRATELDDIAGFVGSNIGNGFEGGLRCGSAGGPGFGGAYSATTKADAHEETYEQSRA
jgi:hypothetical protein